VIGSGPSFITGSLTKGKHNITAAATDPDGNSATAVISIRIRR
jgi:hypothetical protein